jgi:hypothetical protein
MEGTQHSITDELKVQVRAVMTMCDQLKSENRSLTEENGQIVEKLRIKETECEELNNKFEQLKLTRTFQTGSEEAHEGKILVNRMVREIDKCIALLNR